MVIDGNKARVSAALPHELNVRKFAEFRASELEGLHSIVADRLDNNFRSQRNKRKRTTGHDNRVAKKKFRKRGRVGVGDMVKTDSLRKDEKKISRRARRSTELKNNPPSGFSTSGDGTKRLRTHVWHAKRFTMTKLWGFHIALGLHGRGRGSRALLKKLKHGVLLHDASYYGIVQLEGPKCTLVSVLNSVLVPSPSANCEEIPHDILAGNIFGTAMLHHAGKSCFPPVAPVTYMWRPLQRITSNTEGFNTNVLNGEQSVDDVTIVRQLWVWIHAAAFKEAYDALSFACERQMDVTGCSAHCISLEGQLAKLELIGSKVFQLLQKTLLPASCVPENSCHLKKSLADEHDDHGESKKILENSSEISSYAVVPFVVRDPRALSKEGNTISHKDYPLALSDHKECETKGKCVFEYSDLWDSSKGMCPPVEESVLCMEKHHKNKEFIRLGHKSSGTQNASGNGKHSKLCPVLLLKNENHEDSVIR